MIEFDKLSGPNLRFVLGHYPTGVAVVTALHESGPVGMTVGTFTSVSLDPPLVAFLADSRSSTLAMIREADSFCINVLSSTQAAISRRFATSASDKFAGIAWEQTPSGAPKLVDIQAWVDCQVHQVTELGDHLMVTGMIRDLGKSDGELPMLFHRGSYGTFSHVAQARHFDVPPAAYIVALNHARQEMETIARTRRLECLAQTVIDDELVIIGREGSPRGSLPSARLGQTFPLVPPIGASWVAWGGPEDEAVWLDRLGPELIAEKADRYHALLNGIRNRGFAVTFSHRGLLTLLNTLESVARLPRSEVGGLDLREVAMNVDSTFEPVVELSRKESYYVRTVAAPVFNAKGDMVLQLSLRGFTSNCDRDLIYELGEALRAAADRVSAAIRSSAAA